MPGDGFVFVVVPGYFAFVESKIVVADDVAGVVVARAFDVAVVFAARCKDEADVDVGKPRRLEQAWDGHSEC